jgi:hypothetical protein
VERELKTPQKLQKIVKDYTLLSVIENKDHQAE